MGWVSWRREWIWHPPEVLAGAVRVADASGTYPSTLSSSWFEARMNIHSSPCSLSLSETVKTTHNHIPKSKSGSRMVLFCFFFSSSYTSPLVFLYMCSKHLRPESCHDWILQQTDFSRGMKEKRTKRITWVRNSMRCCWRLFRRSAIGSLDPDPRLLANLGWRKWEKTWSKTWYNIKEGYRFSSSLILNLTTENWIPRLVTIIPLYKRKREQEHQCTLLTQRVLGGGRNLERAFRQFLLFLQSFDLGIVCIHCSSGSWQAYHTFLLLLLQMR